MFQIITETYVDGERQPDMVYVKTYKRFGNARRNAVSETINSNGRVIKRKQYVRGFLRTVTREVAKEAYTKGKRIWVDGKYGQVHLRGSWEYCSHAPASELFNRSVAQEVGYDYNGFFYIEDED